MLVQEALFRIKPDHWNTWTIAKTRDGLLWNLERFYGIKRSESWPYSIPKGGIRILKTETGKKIAIKRDYSYEDKIIARLNNKELVELDYDHSKKEPQQIIP